MIHSPIVIDNVFDDITNSIFIDVIKRQRGWHISTERLLEIDSLNNDQADTYSDTGMLLKSFDVNQSDYLNNHNGNCNVIAELISNKIIKMSNIKFYGFSIKRYLWNYYNRSSFGVTHKDINDETKIFCSIVYYLNTCDGCTVIGDKSFDSISGRAVIFDSRTLHYGTAPKNDKNRMLLNIMFSCDKLDL
jgi:hypothetical protein